MCQVAVFREVYEIELMSTFAFYVANGSYVCRFEPDVLNWPDAFEQASRILFCFGVAASFMYVCRLGRVLSPYRRFCSVARSERKSRLGSESGWNAKTESTYVMFACYLL